MPRKSINARIDILKSYTAQGIQQRRNLLSNYYRNKFCQNLLMKTQVKPTNTFQLNCLSLCIHNTQQIRISGLMLQRWKSASSIVTGAVLNNLKQIFQRLHHCDELICVFPAADISLQFQIYRFRHFPWLRMNIATFECTKMLPRAEICIRLKGSDYIQT